MTNGRGSPASNGTDGVYDRLDMADDSGEDGNCDAALQVHGIIGRATDQLLDNDDNDAEQVDVIERERKTRPRTGQTAPKRAVNPEREAEIAKMLASPVPPAEVRAHLERTDFGRVPAYMRELLEDLELEEQYINSLPDEVDAPKPIVRLLTAGEKEALLRGLKQQFQQATAIYLKAGPKSRKKDGLEAELDRIKKDIENISRPYIFVEAGT